jgi:Uma2 family endonuclease
MAQAAIHPGFEIPRRMPPREPMTYDAFLSWIDEETHAEWVDGRVVFMSPVSRDHATISEFLLKVISSFAEIRQVGEVHADPFQMKTGPELPGRAPDVVFVAKENLGRFKANYLDGPADLVVEVISPECRSRDRGEKFYEYEQGGVKEYWLIDPDRRRAEFYQRGSDGFYQPVAAGPDGRYHSAVLPGLWVRVEWLWLRPPPALPEILKEWQIA